VNRVNAYYNTEEWLDHHNEVKKISESNLKVKRRQRKMDFGKHSKPFHAVNELYDIRKDFMDTKVDVATDHQRFIVSRPKIRRKGRSLTPNREEIYEGATTMYQTLLEKDDDTKGFVFKDSIWAREEQALRDRRKSPFHFNKADPPLPKTYDEVREHRMKLLEQIKMEEANLSERKNFFMRQKIEKVKRAVETDEKQRRCCHGHCKIKDPLPDLPHLLDIRPESSPPLHNPSSTLGNRHFSPLARERPQTTSLNHH